jgi:hypothetical protein
LSPEPTRNPLGEPGSWWYDSGTDVLLTVQSISGYTFLYWDVDGTPRNSGLNPITVSMNSLHTAIAHYQITPTPPPPPPPPPPRDHISVGGTMVLVKTSEPVVQTPRLEILPTFSVAILVSILLIRRRKRRQ